MFVFANVCNVIKIKENAKFCLFVNIMSTMQKMFLWEKTMLFVWYFYLNVIIFCCYIKILLFICRHIQCCISNQHDFVFYISKFLVKFLLTERGKKLDLNVTGNFKIKVLEASSELSLSKTFQEKQEKKNGSFLKIRKNLCILHK